MPRTLMKEDAVLLQLFPFLRRINNPSLSRNFSLPLDGTISKKILGIFFLLTQLLWPKRKDYDKTFKNINLLGWFNVLIVQCLGRHLRYLFTLALEVQENLECSGRVSFLGTLSIAGRGRDD